MPEAHSSRKRNVQLQAGHVCRREDKNQVMAPADPPPEADYHEQARNRMELATFGTSPAWDPWQARRRSFRQIASMCA